MQQNSSQQKTTKKNERESENEQMGKKIPHRTQQFHFACFALCMFVSNTSCVIAKGRIDKNVRHTFSWK